MAIEGDLTVIKMPINKKGEGPEMDSSKVVMTHYELWDATSQTIATCDKYGDAVTLAAAYNVYRRKSNSTDLKH